MLTVDGARSIHDPGAVYVEGNRIIDVGPSDAIAAVDDSWGAGLLGDQSPAIDQDSERDLRRTAEIGELVERGGQDVGDDDVERPARGFRRLADGAPARGGGVVGLPRRRA